MDEIDFLLLKKTFIILRFAFKIIISINQKTKQKKKKEKYL